MGVRWFVCMCACVVCGVHVLLWGFELCALPMLGMGSPEIDNPTFMAFQTNTNQGPQKGTSKATPTNHQCQFKSLFCFGLKKDSSSQIGKKNPTSFKASSHCCKCQATWWATSPVREFRPPPICKYTVQVSTSL